MAIESYMTKKVMTCSPDDTLDRAAALMWQHDCGCVPVVDAERRVVGMLTDRDICMAAYTQGQPIHQIAIRGVMATDVRAAAPGDSVGAAEELMRDRQVRRVPVVDADGRLVGLLSLSDVARMTSSRQDRGSRAEVGHPELVATLAAICRPRQVPAPSASR